MEKIQLTQHSSKQFQKEIDKEVKKKSKRLLKKCKSSILKKKTKNRVFKTIHFLIEIFKIILTSTKIYFYFFS